MDPLVGLIRVIRPICVIRVPRLPRRSGLRPSAPRNDWFDGVRDGFGNGPMRLDIECPISCKILEIIRCIDIFGRRTCLRRSMR